MELNHIQESECAICGSRAKYESQADQHCNGDWNESRSFSCGRKVSYSPNFRTVGIVSQCPNDPDELAIIKKRKQAKERLVNYIKKLDVDGTYISRLLSNVEYT